MDPSDSLLHYILYVFMSLWLAHGTHVSVGHGDRWTALVCVVQCARYPCYPSAAQRSWWACCWVHHVIGVQIHDRIGGGLWRTIWLSTKIERFWFFVLVWKPFLLGTGTSTISNGKTSSPNMEKNKDVGQILRKWEMFKTVTLFLKRPVVWLWLIHNTFKCLCK